MSELSTQPKPSLWQILAVGRNPKVTAVRLLFLAILAVVGFKLSIVPVRVTGISMEPTFLDGKALYLRRLTLSRKPLERGDIVAIRMAGMHRFLLKRIVGLPGEHVAIRAGEVRLDGQILAEPYLKPEDPSQKSPVRWNWPKDKKEETLATDEYLVIGDNRTMDQDLHEWGVVKFEKIVGRLAP